MIPRNDVLLTNYPSPRRMTSARLANKQDQAKSISKRAKPLGGKFALLRTLSIQNTDTIADDSILKAGSEKDTPVRIMQTLFSSGLCL